MDRLLLHYGIHFILPIVIAFLFFKENRTRAVIILLAGILIDVDHVFADPIFDPNRCSISFHPLHSYLAIGIYVMLLFFKESRIFGIALLIHILADLSDCYLITQQFE